MKFLRPDLTQKVTAHIKKNINIFQESFQGERSDLGNLLTLRSSHRQRGFICTVISFFINCITWKIQYNDSALLIILFIITTLLQTFINVVHCKKKVLLKFIGIRIQMFSRNIAPVKGNVQCSLTNFPFAQNVIDKARISMT